MRALHEKYIAILDRIRTGEINSPDGIKKELQKAESEIKDAIIEWKEAAEREIHLKYTEQSGANIDQAKRAEFIAVALLDENNEINQWAVSFLDASRAKIV